MSVSNVSANAANVYLMAVADGIPRLLHGYGALRKALDLAETAPGQDTRAVVPADHREESPGESENTAGLRGKAAREFQALQAAFQASDLTSARRAFVALKQALDDAVAEPDEASDRPESSDRSPSAPATSTPTEALVTPSGPPT